MMAAPASPMMRLSTRTPNRLFLLLICLASSDGLSISRIIGRWQHRATVELSSAGERTATDAMPNQPSLGGRQPDDPTSAWNSTQNELKTLGVPSVLEQLPLHASVLAYRHNIRTPSSTKRPTHTQNITIERVSWRPPIFVLHNFLTTEECDFIVSEMKQQQQQQQQQRTRMKPARTALGSNDATKRRNSFVGWLSNDQLHGLPGRLAHAAWAMLIPPVDVSASHIQPQGVEDMQVVHYEPGGEYVLHHDGNNRLLTLLYYLSDSGETWFPLAKVVSQAKEEQGREVISRPIVDRSQALERAKGCVPGRDGLLLSTTTVTTASKIEVNDNNNTVPIQKGDAIAFYSYLGDDKDGNMDWQALHAGLPANKTKWVANHWFHYTPS